MQAEAQILEHLSAQVGDVMIATAFVVFGLAAAVIAIIRRRSGIRLFLWLAIWSGTYGIRLLIEIPVVRINFTPQLQFLSVYITVFINYFQLVFAQLFWWELVRDKMRIFLQIMVIVVSAIGLTGIGWFIITGSPDTLMPYNNFLAAISLVVLIVIIMVKRFSDRFLVLPQRGILAAGTLVFAAEALYSNLSLFLHYRTLSILGQIGFAVLLLSLAYVAAQMVFTNERRLFAIETELETARKIQSSILPAGVPELKGLRIAAAYYPMTSVAGDFYDFIRINQNQAGFLVADVSGHGVPAALIASMIKVAMQTVAKLALDPAALLKRLNEILGQQLRGQFLTASYLYIDSQIHRARYSAAGHPPLLYWDSAAQQLQFIESNGLFIGAKKEADYPNRELTFSRGDRFLLYTDGLTEAMNAAGEAFGDHRLDQVIHSNTDVPAPQLGSRLIAEIRLWQNPGESQQDDITWIIVDVLE
jgi:sigma-B regulation protein RsbU (phosphoserine phosphatase)